MSRCTILGPDGRRYVKPLGFGRRYYLADDVDPYAGPEVPGQLIPQDHGSWWGEDRKREERK